MMYLLLRNNKQSGPYSLDDLKTMGLKAYDLVWVDGKSAAWRYPCEVEELSAFAPAVEEQPFDRFYKKTSTAKSAVTTAGNVEKNTLPAGSDPAYTSIQHTSAPYTGESSTVPGRRIIYVTMPAGKGPAILRESTIQRESTRNNGGTSVIPVVPTRTVEPRPIDIQFVDPPPRKTPVQAENTDLAAYQPVPAENDHPASAYQPVPAATGHRDNRTEPVEKLSQFQDNWKNTVELTPPARKRTRARVLQPLLVVACILALLAAGIFIGLSINKDSLGFRQKIAARDALKDNGRIDRTSQQLPVAVTTSPAPVPNNQSLSATDSVQAGLSAASSGNTPHDAAAGKAQPPRQTSPREKTPAGNNRVQTVPLTSAHDSAAASMAIPVIHREAVHRTDLPAADKGDNVDKEVVRSNIANLVAVGANGYTVGTFGGISDLQLTVSNRSVYPLDLVVVEVQYIQANKKTFKTENLYFRGIGPGSALMQEAPKSARGIKVQYKIILVNSKELGLSYSGI